MVTLVGVVDVGLGNIRSVHRIIERAGGCSISVSNGADLEKVSSLVLPGVGHFDAGITAIRRASLLDPLREFVLGSGKPVLGICLGMQLLCRESEEGSEQGLGVIPATVRKFQFQDHDVYKVPHMGWGIVKVAKVNPLLPVISEEQRYYFVHSYRVVPEDSSITIGYTDYGGTFCVAFQQGNVFGVQFHPEKSHRFGLELIKRFVELLARPLF